MLQSLERTVGIQHTLNLSDKKLTGVVKSRYSDFLVHEIDENEKVVHLTKFWPHAIVVPATDPVAQEGGSGSGAGASPPAAEPGSAPPPPSDPFARLEEIIGGELAGAVKGILDALPGVDTQAVTVPLPEDKVVRRSLHETVRALSRGTLDSDTLTLGDGTRCIRISRPPRGVQAGKRARDEGRSPAAPDGTMASTGWRRNGWDASRPPYVRFVLHKVNMDCGMAIRGLAKALGCKERSIGYAGIKDKRAATTQVLSMYRMEPERISRAVRAVKGLAVGDFSYCKDPLHLGQLWGNRFTITVRGVEVVGGGGEGGVAPHIRSAMGGWEGCGYRFVSYFGLQRFGGTASLGHSEGGLRTHLVGKALLCGDWCAALTLILSPRQWDTSEIGVAATAALLAFSKGEATPGETLKALPLSHIYSLERQVLEEVNRRWSEPPSKDTASSSSSGGSSSSSAVHTLGKGKALEVVLAMPPKQRSFYVHAYQSLLWNELASARCGGTFSREWAVEGDLVVLSPTGGSGGFDLWEGGTGDEDELQEVEVGEGERGEEANGSGSGSGSGPPPLPTATTAPALTAATPGFGLPPPSLIHCVTEEEASKHVYPIEDVILPIPGSAVVFSPSPVWGLPALVSLLRRDGFSLQQGEGESLEGGVRALFTPKDRRFHHTGGYRRLIGRARDVSWKLVHHKASEENLAETDFEAVLKARGGGALGRGGRGGQDDKKGEGGGEVQGEGEPCAPTPSIEGPLIALQLSFSLRKSHYATMALREVLC
jgi:tRNA pseudouridine13 synthase